MGGRQKEPSDDVSKRGLTSLDRGFTIVELIVAIVVCILLGAVLAVWLTSEQRTQREIKNASYLRGISQAFVVWGQGTNQGMPVPSELDLLNATTREIGAAKDHSANMWSMLVYAGFVPVDLLVSPLECNANIQPFSGYQATAPNAAVDPANALWDPAFTADFTKRIGGVSDANLPHTQGRRSIWKRASEWSSHPQARIPLLSNRGPQLMQRGSGRNGISPANPRSNTLDQSGTWRGSVVFSDIHVEMVTGFSGGWRDATNHVQTYTDMLGAQVVDIPFWDEPDDPLRTNTYLGIFTTAGDKDSDFTAIWD